MSREKEVTEKAVALVEQAKGIVILDDEQYAAAAEFLKGIVDLRREIKAVFDPIVDAAHKAHKAATAQRAAALKPVEEAEAIARRAVAKYREEQEAAKAAAIKEEEERRALEQTALEVTAESAIAAGDLEEAKAIYRDLHQLMKEPSVQVTPKVEGVTFREIWRFEITDEKALPREYLTPDLKKIGGYVSAMKGESNIPGVRVWAEKVVAVGGAR